MLAVGIVMCVISALCLLVSLRHFRQKGFLFNNAYIYASKEERERGDYSPHYRQSAIVFLMIALQFLMIALFAFTGWAGFFFLQGMIILAVVIYAIISSMQIEKKRLEKEHQRQKETKKEG